MQAIGFEAAGGVEVLKQLTLPRPTPVGSELLVQVKAVATNPVDTKVRRGLALGAPYFPRVLGYDAAGIVVATGPDATRFKVGDHVFYAGAVQRNGSNSEFQVVDERLVGRMPRNLSFAAAAAVPLVFLTAWEAMVEQLCIAPGTGGGKSILIVGGAGGVGSVASQIAKHVLGLTVISTASRPESIDFAKKHGADHVIDHKGSLVEGLAAIGFGEGVDYAFCCVDLELHYAALTTAVKPCGRIVGITLQDSSKIDVFALFVKRLTLSMELMFTRALFNTPDMGVQGAILDKAAELLEAGTIVSTATVERPLTVENLQAAHTAQESGAMCGKQVLVAQW